METRWPNAERCVIRLRGARRFALPAALAGLCLLAAPATSQGEPAFAEPDGWSVQIAQSTSETIAWKPTREQVRAAQRRLEQLDFDPGAADGNFGPRSTAALRAYQQSIGVEPDGRLTEAVFRRLMGWGEPEPEPQPELEPQPEPELTPTPEAAPVPEAAAASDDDSTAPDAAPTATPDLASCGGRFMGFWAVEDEQGSRFELGLLKDGIVEGPFYTQNWSWRPVAGGVEIHYDNGMGVSVTRHGLLQGEGQLSGSAEDSRGNRWSWQATRVTSRSADAAPCPSTG